MALIRRRRGRDAASFFSFLDMENAMISGIGKTPAWGSSPSTAQREAFESLRREGADLQRQARNLNEGAQARAPAPGPGQLSPTARQCLANSLLGLLGYSGGMRDTFAPRAAIVRRDAPLSAPAGASTAALAAVVAVDAAAGPGFGTLATSAPVKRKNDVVAWLVSQPEQTHYTTGDADFDALLGARNQWPKSTTARFQLASDTDALHPEDKALFLNNRPRGVREPWPFSEGSRQTVRNVIAYLNKLGPFSLIEVWPGERPDLVLMRAHALPDRPNANSHLRGTAFNEVADKARRLLEGSDARNITSAELEEGKRLTDAMPRRTSISLTLGGSDALHEAGEEGHGAWLHEILHGLGLRDVMPLDDLSEERDS
ncbi:MAG: hypothetical protein MO853_07565 [Candidatus Protistobacter heckmanni]|nr:hypothetical protein [Candidatus Protistobacter heckmanni]